MKFKRYIHQNGGKMDFNYGFNYNQALIDKDKIIQQIEFPYIKYYVNESTIRKYFDKLSHAKITIMNRPFNFTSFRISPDDMKFRGKHHIIINYLNEYPDLEIISDYFNQNCRVRCVHEGDVSPLDNFKINFDNIIKLLESRKKSINIENLDYATYEFTKVQCTMFKPKIIKYLIELFSAKKLLDISSGWGDRLIGAMAANVELYHGFDPNPCLHKGYQEMINFFKPKGEFIIKQLPFEKAQLTNNFYDMVMSSPPYFDIEVYIKEGEGIEEQSIHGVNETEWYSNYLMKWIEICHQALKHHGILALNINQYKKHHYVEWLLADMKKNTGWEYLGLIAYSNEKLNKPPQPIFIWKKL